MEQEFTNLIAAAPSGLTSKVRRRKHARNESDLIPYTSTQSGSSDLRHSKTFHYILDEDRRTRSLATVNAVLSNKDLRRAIPQLDVDELQAYIDLLDVSEFCLQNLP